MRILWHEAYSRLKITQVPCLAFLSKGLSFAFSSSWARLCLVIIGLCGPTRGAFVVPSKLKPAPFPIIDNDTEKNRLLERGRLNLYGAYLTFSFFKFRNQQNKFDLFWPETTNFKPGGDNQLWRILQNEVIGERLASTSGCGHVTEKYRQI